jgi:hypothetical protein
VENSRQVLKILFNRSAKLLTCKTLNFFYRFEPIFRFTKLYQLEKKHAHNGFLKMADEIIDEKRKNRNNIEKSSSLTECDQDGLKKKPKIFVETLLDPKNELSYEEIKDEINTLIAAVSETPPSDTEV